MSHRGIANWPPTWVRVAGVGHRVLTGEVGVLEQVVDSIIDAGTSCYLVIRHEDSTYMGALLFDDAMFRAQRHHIGKSIASIGDLDVSHVN